MIRRSSESFLKWKREAVRETGFSFRRHYGILLAVCLLSALSGGIFAWTGTVRKAAFAAAVYFAEGALPSESRIPSLRVIKRLAEGDLDGALEIAEAAEKRILGSEPLDPALSRERGAVASVLNAVETGKPLAEAVGRLNETVRNVRLSFVLVMILPLLILLVLFVLFRSFDVVMARMSLESLVYEKVGFRRFRFFGSFRKWIRVSWIMTVRTVERFITAFTVVYGFVVGFARAMVPYLLAESPDLTLKEAMTLSKKMMEGHKGELFRLRLTFWPYYLAAVLTLGLSDVFFGAPYRQCIYALYYRFVREDAMRRNVPGIERLTDRYLFERPDAETLAEAYGSVPEKVSRLKVLGSKKGFKSVLLRTFGITWRNPEGLADEKERICLREELRTAVPESEGKAYPDLLVGRRTKDNAKRLYALLPVNVTELIALFLIFALIGWLWETVYQFLMFGNYVKRGMLYGPWIPIYGVGGGLFLLLFYRFRNRPVRECLLMILAAGILEYGTAWALFKIYGTMWWDYKGYFLNLNRWICLEGLLAFAVGGLLGVYLAAPIVRRLLEKPKPKMLAIAVAVVITLFFADVVFSMTHPRTGEYITFDPYDTTMEQRGNDL